MRLPVILLGLQIPYIGVAFVPILAIRQWLSHGMYWRLLSLVGLLSFALILMFGLGVIWSTNRHYPDELMRGAGLAYLAFGAGAMGVFIAAQSNQAKPALIFISAISFATYPIACAIYTLMVDPSLLLDAYHFLDPWRQIIGDPAPLNSRGPNVFLGAAIGYVTAVIVLSRLNAKELGKWLLLATVLLMPAVLSSGRTPVGLMLVATFLAVLFSGQALMSAIFRVAMASIVFGIALVGAYILDANYVMGMLLRAEEEGFETGRIDLWNQFFHDAQTFLFGGGRNAYLWGEVETSYYYHNIIMDTYREYGVFCAAALALLGLLSVVSAIRRLLFSQDVNQKAEHIAVLCAVLAAQMEPLVQTSAYGIGFYVFWCVVGIGGPQACQKVIQR